MGEQVAHRELRADAVLGEWLSRWIERMGVAFEAARGEANVGRHRDVASVDVLGNPIVCRVGAFADHDSLDPGSFRHAKPGIGDHENGEPVAPGDPDYLLLHGAGVRVDVNRGHGQAGRKWGITSSANRSSAARDCG